MKKRRKKLVLDTRAKYCIAGAAALLAVLTVVLCAMNGAFQFTAEEAEPTPTPPAATPVVTDTPATPVVTDAPVPTATPEPERYTITVTAGKGGSVSPTGQVTVAEGDDCVFAITPDAGYVLETVQADGQDVGAVTAYTFPAVAEDHTLYVEFRAEETTPPTETPEVTAPPVSASDITA